MNYKPVPLPNLTHLQALVCWALQSPYWETLTVRELLGLLKGHGADLSESAFYQLMHRMESAGLVETEVELSRRSRVRMQSRRYQLTRLGRTELARTMEFYQSHREHPRRFFHVGMQVSLLTEDDWNGDRAVKPIDQTISMAEDE